MDRTTLIIFLGVAVLALGGILAYAFGYLDISSWNNRPSPQEETGAVPLELSPEEQQALRDAGQAIPQEDAASLNALRQTSSSDELSDISSDLNATNLSGLGSELDAIGNDLSSL